VDANFNNLNNDKAETSVVAAKVAQTSSTGSAVVPTGTAAQRNGTPLTGYFRFNTDAASFEGYNGTTWASIGGGAFPSGTVMLFSQTAAPTGWTKSTAHDNKALRVVSGTVGSGGSVAFTTAFATPSVTGTVSVSGTVGSTTLTAAQMPSHTHAVMGSTSTGQTRGSREGSSRNIQGGDGTAGRTYGTTAPTGGENYLQLTGSSTGHDHTFSGSGSLSAATTAINVQYVDVIFATKD
jgi:hypothetical protein